MVEVHNCQLEHVGWWIHGHRNVDWLISSKPCGDCACRLHRIWGKMVIPVWSTISANVVTWRYIRHALMHSICNWLRPSSCSASIRILSFCWRGCMTQASWQIWILCSRIVWHTWVSYLSGTHGHGVVSTRTDCKKPAHSWYWQRRISSKEPSCVFTCIWCRRIMICWVSILCHKWQRPMPPITIGAKTMTRGRQLWYPILFRITEVDRLWILSKKESGSQVAGSRYVSAGRKHDQYRTPTSRQSIGIWRSAEVYRSTLCHKCCSIGLVLQSTVIYKPR